MTQTEKPGATKGEGKKTKKVLKWDTEYYRDERGILGVRIITVEENEPA